MKATWIALYVASVLLANLTLNHFIPLPVFGLLSVGTVFFAAVFTLRDKLHGYGLRTVLLAIAAALLVNVLAAWLTDTPARFVFASFVAIAASELADTAVFQRLRARRWLARALGSNAVSVPLDSVLFALLAFHGMMSGAEILAIIWADILFKTLIAAALALALNHWRTAPAPAPA